MMKAEIACLVELRKLVEFLVLWLLINSIELLNQNELLSFTIAQ